MSGHLKCKWEKLTDNNLGAVGGKKDQLVDKLHERHVFVKDEAEKQIDECVRDPYNFDIWLLFNTSLTQLD